MKNYQQVPESHEYPPYYQTYLKHVPPGNIFQIMEDQSQEIVQFFTEIGEEKANDRYHPDKWSIKEVLGHIIDSERIFACRALCIARGETEPLPGFEQDDYVENAPFSEMRLRDLIIEFEDLRRSNLSMTGNFSEEMMGRMGIANNFTLTVRAILWAMVGHSYHHLKIIREKYL